MNSNKSLSFTEFGDELRQGRSGIQILLYMACSRTHTHTHTHTHTPHTYIHTYTHAHIQRERERGKKLALANLFRNFANVMYFISLDSTTLSLLVFLVKSSAHFQLWAKFLTKTI